MRGRNHLIPFLTMSVLAVLAGASSALADGTVRIDSSVWDRAVDNLLAAGMYGIGPEVSLGLQGANTFIPGPSAGLERFSGHAITLSYRGSFGLLGFSSGYIYTSDRMPGPAGSLFAGPNPEEQHSVDPGTDWFMAIDLSGDRQLHHDLTIGLGGRTVLMKDPHDQHNGRILSFLLNMPMSYKKFITITPELQWSHSLSAVPFSSGGAKVGNRQDRGQDIFYGGVSVTFSY